MKNSKAFLGLILIISLFGIAKFFGIESSGSEQTQASLEAAQEQDLQIGGDIFTGQRYENQVNSRTEITADPKTAEYVDQLEMSATSTSQSCFESSGARYYLVKYADGGDMLSSYGEDNRWPIASITKLMSAVIVYENSDLNKPIELTAGMLAFDGTAGDFKEGEKFTGKDLLRAALLVSSNDAIEALAMDLDNSKFVELMNKKAQELRMDDTFFIDPTGLSLKNQSTPNDIYRLVNYIASNQPEILSITRTKSFDITNLQNNKKRKIYNMNEFAGQSNFIGGKTGFIPESGGNLVSLFNRNDQRLFVLVLDSEDRFESTKKIISCIK